MTVLTFFDPYIRPREQDFPDDVARLVAVAAAHGAVLSPTDAARVWEAYSDSYAAGWLSLRDTYTDAFLWSVITLYTREVPA
jgi:hypothetical protein